MNFCDQFVKLNFLLFLSFFNNISFVELSKIFPVHSKAHTRLLDLNLSNVTIKPFNPNFEIQIHKQFDETGVIELPLTSGNISFRIVVTCASDCPAQWTFDNMRHMYEAGNYPQIVPSRIFGNLNHPFRSDLVLEGALMTNFYPHPASFLSGKYTCKCSMDSDNNAPESFFYGFFQSDTISAFVHSSKLLSLRPELEDKWIGLGCTAQIQNASTSLRMGKQESKNWISWVPLALGENENVRRDPSQGFVVSVDAEDRETKYYKCDQENSSISVSITLEPPARSDTIKYLTPVLTFNRTANEFRCCVAKYFPIGSFVNCNNKDECIFRANRRIGSFLPHTGCIRIPGDLGIECCTYAAPRVGGLMRCYNPVNRTFYSTSMIFDDERATIAEKPQIIRDLENEEGLSLQCTASSFTFSNYLHWELQLWNGTTLSIQNGSLADYIMQNSTEDDKSGTITSKLQIPKNIEVEKASCFAPLIGSKEWRNDTMEFDQLVVGTSDDTGPAAVIILTLTAIILGVVVVSVGLWILRQPRVLTQQDIQKFLKGGATSKSKDDTISLMNSAVELSDFDKNYEDLLRLPYNKDFEFPRSSFNYDKNSNKLGEGAFGVVYSGKLRVTEDKECNVAIKMIIANVTREKLISILAEIKIMSYVGSHVNVVNLMGANTRHLNQNKVLMAVELCTRGSLEDFITKNKNEFNRPRIDGYDLQVPHFSTRALVKWAGEIAHGMIFLSSKKVIHVDLATRNVFLTDNLIPKIGDFGLSRRLYTKEIYLKKSQEYLPIYWMALESLKSLTFSTQSDVWSFGVTIWEMFALSHEPYKTAGDLQKPTWDQMVMFLSSGRRLLQPEHASASVYAVMEQCWNEDPNLRPSFQILRDTFLKELEQLDCFTMTADE